MNSNFGFAQRFVSFYILTFRTRSLHQIKFTKLEVVL